MSNSRPIQTMGAIAAVLLLAGATGAAPAHSSRSTAIPFTNARKQAAEFIAADGRIDLSPTQQSVMQEALSKIAAPCCADYSMATCCCPCNLAKSTWGLSKVLITRHHATASEVKQAVNEWLAVVNSDGFTGDACFTGGCGRAFHKNGCGGMDAKKLI